MSADDWMEDQLNGSDIKYRTVTVDYKYRELLDKINKKIIDLQGELLQHAYEGKTRLNDNDVLRYSAMVEILKAMLQ